MYTAKLGRNFRDVETTTPKVLLTEVKSGPLDFRDGHCHIKLDEVSSVIPKEGYYAKIAFQADEVIYYKRGETCLTLANLKLVKVTYHKLLKSKSQQAKKSHHTVLKLLQKLHKEA